jgi:hypothetical protein
MFLQNGFNDYLSKPIEIARLNEVMDTWVPAHKKMQQEARDTDEEKPALLPEGLAAEGLDLRAGKERYGEDAYLEVLRSYCIHTPALLEKMRNLTKAALKAGAVGEYTITVHGIKGSSYGICADGAAKQAEALEHAARGGDMAFIEANNSRFIETAETLLQNIQNLLAGINGRTAAKPRSPSPDPALLEELLAACKHYKASLMEETLRKLEGCEYESGGELVAWLREQADNLEYDAIVERLSRCL